MDTFTQLANDILQKNNDILKENHLAEISPQSGQSFGDFLRSLVGKSREDILDSGSYARLFSMNMHGIGSASNDTGNPAVLMSRFLTKFGDYVNEDITKYRSGAAETDGFKNRYDYEGHLAREKERKDLLRQVMTETDPEKKSILRQKANAFRNNSEYAEARRALYSKEDEAVDEFHSKPIEQGELVNDGSDEFKELESLFNNIQNMRSGNQEVEDQEVEDQESGIRSLDGFFSDEESHIEDQESFLDPEQTQAVQFAQKLATDPKGKMLGQDPQKAINKAYGAKMIEIANKIKSIKI